MTFLKNIWVMTAMPSVGMKNQIIAMAKMIILSITWQVLIFSACEEICKWRSEYMCTWDGNQIWQEPNYCRMKSRNHDSENSVSANKSLLMVSWSVCSGYWRAQFHGISRLFGAPGSSVHFFPSNTFIGHMLVLRKSASVRVGPKFHAWQRGLITQERQCWRQIFHC